MKKVYVVSFDAYFVDKKDDRIRKHFLSDVVGVFKSKKKAKKFILKHWPNAKLLKDDLETKTVSYKVVSSSELDYMDNSEGIYWIKKMHIET